MIASNSYTFGFIAIPLNHLQNTVIRKPYKVLFISVKIKVFYRKIIAIKILKINASDS